MTEAESKNSEQQQSNQSRTTSESLPTDSFPIYYHGHIEGPNDLEDSELYDYLQNGGDKDPRFDLSLTAKGDLEVATAISEDDYNPGMVTKADALPKSERDAIVARAEQEALALAEKNNLSNEEQAAAEVRIANHLATEALGDSRQGSLPGAAEGFKAEFSALMRVISQKFEKPEDMPADMRARLAKLRDTIQSL